MVLSWLFDPADQSSRDTTSKLRPDRAVKVVSCRTYHVPLTVVLSQVCVFCLMLDMILTVFWVYVYSGTHSPPPTKDE